MYDFAVPTSAGGRLTIRNGPLGSTAPATLPSACLARERVSAFADMRMCLLFLYVAGILGAGDVDLHCRWERKFYRGGGEPNVSFTRIDIRTKGKQLEGNIDGAGFHERLANGSVSGNKFRFTTGTKGDRLFAEWELIHTAGKDGEQVDGAYRYPDGLVGNVTARCTSGPER